MHISSLSQAENRLTYLRSGPEGFTSEGPKTSRLNPDNYHIGRSLKATPDYFKNVADNPFRPAAALANLAHSIGFKPVSDGIRAVRGAEPLKELGAYRRTKESSIGAVSDTIGGIGDTFRGKLIKGPLRTINGVIDFIDIVPSAVADSADSITGVEHGTRARAQKTLALAA